MAVASDCNPGTSPMPSMLAAIHLACAQFRLTPEEALAGATRHAARALGLELETGTLEAGRAADIAVWDHDLYTMPSADIKNLKCELTLFAGRIVYQDAAAPITIRKQ